MNRSIVLLATTIAVVAVALLWSTTPRVESAQRNVQSPSGWEYARLIVDLDGVTWDPGGVNTPRVRTMAAAINDQGAGGLKATLANLLNAIGANGWELVQVEGDAWIFKRLK